MQLGTLSLGKLIQQMLGRRIGHDLVTGLLQTTFHRCPEGRIVVHNMDTPPTIPWLHRSPPLALPAMSLLDTEAVRDQPSVPEGRCRKNGMLPPDFSHGDLPIFRVPSITLVQSEWGRELMGDRATAWLQDG